MEILNQLSIPDVDNFLLRVPETEDPNRYAQIITDLRKENIRFGIYYRGLNLVMDLCQVGKTQEARRITELVIERNEEELKQALHTEAMKIALESSPIIQDGIKGLQRKPKELSVKYGKTVQSLENIALGIYEGRIPRQEGEHVAQILLEPENPTAIKSISAGIGDSRSQIIGILGWERDPTLHMAIPGEADKTRALVAFKVRYTGVIVS